METYRVKGQTISELPADPETFLNRNTVIYGASRSGKTTIILHILKLLSPYIPIIYGICPTNTSNNLFTDLLPPPFIKDAIDKDFLTDLWQLQTTKAQQKSIAQNPVKLRRVFEKLCNEEDLSTLLSIDMNRENEIRRLSTRLELTRDDREILAKKATALFENQKTSYMKSVIKREREPQKERIEETFSTEEKIVVKYARLNPNILIIMDDMTSEISKLHKAFSKAPTNILEDIFFKGRHFNITTIIACHSDVALVPSIRANANLSIFGTSESLLKFFGNVKSNGVSKEDGKFAEEASKVVYTDDSYRKLVYNREEATFYWFQAALHTHGRYGQSQLWELADRMPKAENIESLL